LSHVEKDSTLGTPFADGNSSLRCAIVNHSIVPESRVAPVVADDVLLLWSQYVRRETPTTADVDCSCGPIWRNTPSILRVEPLQQLPMAFCSCGPIWRKTPTTADGDCSCGPIWRNSPADADGDSSLRCAIVNHSVDPESQVAPAVADGVLFLWSHVEKDSNNGRW